MYFMLGNIRFEPIDMTDFSEAFSANFAEHQVLLGKPKLQAMGEDLIELNFAIRLHYKIGGVESRYQALIKAQSAQQALTLVWGGKCKGNFVIQAIRATTLFTDARGNPLCRELDIQLKEFVGENGTNLLGEALNIGGGSLLGTILPEGAVAALSEIKSAISKGVELYNQGKQLVNEVQNTIAVARQMIENPTLALSYLPSALNGLNGALGSFGKITGMSALFEGVQSVLPVISEFSQEVGYLYQDIQVIKQDVEQVIADVSTQNWGSFFHSADQAFNRINNSVEVLAPKVAEMTAWIILREDEESL